MKTFCVTTLGCKVNHYESEQIAGVLRARGLVAVNDAAEADLRIINTCSVTSEAASKSRQAVRRMVRLPVLATAGAPVPLDDLEIPSGQRVLVTGCWATSHPEEARALPGVDAVVGHHDDVAAEVHRLLREWAPGPPEAAPSGRRFAGTTRLPLLSERQEDRQRAVLKIQDGCDAHCTYCIIPRLRPKLWSKPVEDVVDEAQRMVDAGHRELVLTGIFLSAYGQPTALHRRQPENERSLLAGLIEALCRRVRGLMRLRLSSLEPGDLRGDLLDVLSGHEQVMPHFHLPLQSGSDAILRRMNRQYGRDDFLRMVDQVRRAFDRPAITTDIIVGFPGETDAEFQKTLDVATQVGFIHTHAFSYSARPGTAAARWRDGLVPGNVANDRIATLRSLAQDASVVYRRQFIGEPVTALVEQRTPQQLRLNPGLHHGRTERYFSVWFDSRQASSGDWVTIRVDRIAGQRTMGTLLERTGR